MSTFGKIVRYFFSTIFIFILLLLFFVGLPVASVTQTFVNRENVKEVINSSGIYDNFVDLLVDFTQDVQLEDSSEEMEGFILLLQDDSDFKETLSNLFSSDEMKEKVNTVIDAFYDWFEGKTNTLDFEVYLIDDEDTFKELFGSVMISTFKNLPVCSSSSDMDSSINPLDVECIPEGVDLDDIEPLLESGLTTDEDSISGIMESFKFSSDQLNIPFDTTALVQTVYSFVKIFPILLAVLIFVLTLIIILLIPGAKGGFITASVIYILIGLLFLTVSSLANVNQIISNSISMANINISYTQVRDLSTTFLSPIFDMIFSKMLTYSLVVIGVGVVLLLIGILIKKKVKEESSETKEVKDKENTNSK